MLFITICISKLVFWTVFVSGEVEHKGELMTFTFTFWVVEEILSETNDEKYFSPSLKLRFDGLAICSNFCILKL